MSKWGHLEIVMCLILSTQAWASIGKVSLLKGEASAARDQETIALFNGAPLEQYDVISTRANSQIQLTFEDKTVITLGSESILDIKEYVNDAQNSKAKFKFNQGTFKSITGEIGKKAPENVNLETRTATIGIRGTTILGHIGSDGENGTALSPDIIGCSSGQIVVSAGGTSIVVKQGSQTSVAAGQAPTPPVPLSMTLSQPAPSNAPLSNPKTPVTADQASQTNEQTNAYAGLVSHIDTYHSGFYPLFNPTLQASSVNDGTLYLSGYATSQYIENGVTKSNVTKDFSLVLDSLNDSLLESLNYTYSKMILYHASTLTFDLTKESDASTMTYQNINEFSIKNFDHYKGWIQTENTYPNDYVSWGYWAIKLNDDSKLLITKNYWVAGKDEAAANTQIASFISGSAQSYTYSGHVIGSVNDGANTYAIDPTTNNAVTLNFNFGAGSGSLNNSSSIQFQTTQATPQVWQITPSGTVGGGSFTVQNGNNVAIDGTTLSSSASTIKGTFYGSGAQAIGGTFSAVSGTNTALGVFKAVK